MGGAREEPFAAFVDAFADRLVGTAALVHLDPDHAPALVDAVLSRLYAQWPHLDDPYAAALRAILDPAAGGIRLPGTRTTGFELVDVQPHRLRPDDDIRSELATLPGDERRVLVLVSYTRLPLTQIADVLQRDPGEVVALLQSATRALAAIPRRHRRRRLAAELTAAAPVPEPTEKTCPPRAGRILLRLRRLRLVAAAVALVVVAVVGVRLVLPAPAPVTAGAPADPQPACDTTQTSCRVQIISSWRSAMADVVSEHLDPDGTYFTGFSYSYTEEYLGSGFWDGGGGALALDLYRMREGATEVYLQIATSRDYAIPCGKLTKRQCQGQRFMDGNRFLLTDPFDVAHGLEAQHRPEGSYVITVVARNTSKARQQLPVTRADLVDLIVDPRLRLPAR
jgi:DNA-directed RNA polymerase specialized sigma24 family protein